MRQLFARSLLLAATLIVARTARADDEVTKRQLTATMSAGTLLPEDHVYRLGEVGFSAPPTAYLGVSLEGDLARRVRLEGSFGVEIALGWVAESSLRYVPLERSGFSLAVGVGPLVAFGSTFGTGVFGAGDVEARYVVSKTPFVVALNVGLAFALNDAGSMGCGADTCTAYIRRGDLLETVVASLGYAFNL